VGLKCDDLGSLFPPLKAKYPHRIDRNVFIPSHRLACNWNTKCGSDPLENEIQDMQLDEHHTTL